ncbi:N6-adenosine-methyltransferase 70 kDa subunit [Smittium culicis]|uniref:mRNA m(6)A methyltransferase n=1 Tax=Smittium culicis TaxID=133412 RepID=A0A1R1WZ50_9FUNG|nr:N6-adenosine-methyltransferase 70 kDa subunit [Smittium culicis]
MTDKAKNELDCLLERENDLKSRISALKAEIEELEKEMNIQSESTKKDDKVEEAEEFYAPTYCVPIKANVMDFEWNTLAKACQFDVILMDPPWQLASQAPTRGVAIAYQQLPDICIESLPIQKLQNEGGFLFIWVINNKFNKALQLFTLWGYRFVDEISWVKQTVNRRMAKGHGYYLQHAKETCLVGVKLKSSVMPEFALNSENRISHPIFSQFYSSNNSDSVNYARDDDDEYQDVLEPENVQYCIGSDTIFSERRGQSQKPEELYEMIEQLVPGGTYLEIFGRKNNLRDYWVTVGNEL